MMSWHKMQRAIQFLIGYLCISIIVAQNDQNSTEKHEIEYPPYDGWYNNFAHPDWGAAETPLIRLLPHAYSDGVYKPSGENRPNPINISQIVFNGTTGFPSYRNRTALLVFFGQQLVEEILDAQRAGCPPEYFNIKIPKGHPEFDPHGEGGREMPLQRTRFDQRTGYSPNVPREQLNEISSYFDGTLMYGPNKAWADALRLYKGGRLKATNDTENTTEYFPAKNDIRLPFANPPPPRDHYLKPVSRFFTIGNPRGNENPFLLTFGILWFRYHNVKARQIEAAHPEWSDEKIFNEARKWTIATHQKIVYFDWLPAWLNESLPEYKGYNPQVHPGIAHVFQSAAMRFGHTLVPPGVLRRNRTCHFRKTSLATGFANQTGLRTCNSYWNPQEAIRETDIDELLMGMASQITEREDNIITPDLRGNVFGNLDFSRRDLMAVNIQRGRDHGLPDYNTAREVMGLPKRTNFSEINPDLYNQNKQLFDDLEALYGEDAINNLDIWPAGILETTSAGPGELFRAIIKNQFQRIRDADRFWFENYKMNKLFTEEEIAEIRNITIKHVIVMTTNIGSDDIQDNPFFWHEGDPCPQPMQLHHQEGGGVEDCTPMKSIDYFDGSETSYIITITFVFGMIIPAVLILTLITKCNKGSNERNQQGKNTENIILEWTGKKEGFRPVTIEMNQTKGRIEVKDGSRLLRIIDLSLLQQGQNIRVKLTADGDMKMMSIIVPKEYDLILDLGMQSNVKKFLDDLNQFLRNCGISPAQVVDPVSEKMMKKTAITRAHRQKQLQEFLNKIYSKALKTSPRTTGASQHGTSLYYRTDSLRHEDADQIEMTKFEFAEALGLKPDSMFVENIFQTVDTNGNGYISFREFLNFFVLFTNGSPDDKVELLFNMYDRSGNGQLTREDFKIMIRSMIELTNEQIDEENIDQLTDQMFSSSSLHLKSSITFKEFRDFLDDYTDYIDLASLNFQVGNANQPVVAGRKRQSYKSRANEVMQKSFAPNRATMTATQFQTVQRSEPKESQGRFKMFLNSVHNFFENYWRQIFWATLYSLVTAGVFIERAYYYAIEREYTGLRGSLGYGVSITRGAASAMMFTYSSMLVTMCRSIIALLRETFLNRYIPFDSANSMHKFIGWQAVIYTIAHVIGHCFNFYHISTQTPGDLACLFRNFHYPTHYLPKFTDWAWGTVTGVTGILMCVQLIFIYVFSTEYARRKAFRAFWIIHSTYPAFFILMILHGAGRFIQAPFFYYFFLGPVILYTLDCLISISRKKVKITVLKAELLPSEVTCLKLVKPSSFEYRSGQWIRVACLAHSSNEYHPFTLTSAPHENHLSVHIRAVGPWTRNIRKIYGSRYQGKGSLLPAVYVDGPYGEGHQDWNKYEVSILIGGGIGVTPFASILKDIAHKSQTGQMNSGCNKVYFIWVTRTQRHFEWMTDIIREVEQKDKSDVVVVNTFITQLSGKYDFRTTLLYICEKHFQKVYDRSLFTGLKSKTHFGRPDFDKIFESVRETHPDTNIGVFSCGPPPMTRTVEQACARYNTSQGQVYLFHHYENF